MLLLQLFLFSAAQLVAQNTAIKGKVSDEQGQALPGVSILVKGTKTGTVTEDTAKAVGEVKAGRVEFKLDKNGNVAVPLGKFSFAENQLVENGTAIIEAVVKARPATAKGRFVEGMTLAATMSPGLHIDPSPYLKV